MLRPHPSVPCKQSKGGNLSQAVHVSDKSKSLVCLPLPASPAFQAVSRLARLAGPPHLTRGTMSANEGLRTGLASQQSRMRAR